VFKNADTTTARLVTPDPGRALITGVGKESGLFDNLNAFKIPTLWGVSKTAPYFHDNSARTLEDVVAHYNKFFEVASDFDGPGPQPPLIVLTPGDQADIVAYLKLLN
jgi:cytochrome c peroxidase